MSELGLLYHQRLRAQDFLRAAEQQRLAKIATGKNRLPISRIRPLRRTGSR